MVDRPRTDDHAVASPAWQIGVISAGVLILELALIRQIPAEVRVVSYFTNLVLFAVFFGLGAGAILQRQRSLWWALPLGLAAIAGFIALARGIVIYDEAGSVHYWLQYADIEARAPRVPLLPAIAFAFVAAAAPFVGLGQQLARAMEPHPRLVAYGWDIGGSLAGVLLFTGSSVLGAPPWLWPPLLALLWAVLFGRAWIHRLSTLLAGALFITFAFSSANARWSPYYLVQHQREADGLRVWVNSSFHQFAIDFESRDERLQPMQQGMMTKFSIPHRAYEQRNGRAPSRVLVLGAGTGNDVVVALRNGATSVVAVEIDPVILELGREHNASRPYDDPRVEVRIDDARHFLRATRERFDLIVFGTLDSQTLLSGHTNLRLDNFVYTREAIADARRVLTDGGVLAIYYSIFKPWLAGRLLRTALDGFGPHCSMQLLNNPFLFNSVVTCGASIDARASGPELLRAAEDAIAATDDWPFVYLQRPTIAPVYRSAFALLCGLVLAAFVVLRRLYPVRGQHANFFLLGLGFTLVESAAIVRLALLLGSTWLVNVVVFSAALLMIFLANLAVLRGRAPSLPVAWIAVVVGLLINAALPLHVLLFLPGWARALVAAALVGVPVFFAAVCFSRLFARERYTGYALGINFIGAMAGGGLEYLSMVLGMNGVWLLALGVYLGAWLATRVAAR